MKYRHEIKMSINSFDKQILRSRLSHMLKKDRYTKDKGYYIVRSIYFDDDNDRALKEKIMGVKYREKFRIRTYDHSTSFIRLEKKVKNGNLGYKESGILSLDECQRLLNGEYDFFKYRKEDVCKHLYAKMTTGLFKPKTIVEYDRVAYTWDPGRIRITIDSNLKTGMNSTDFLNPNIPMIRTGEQSNAILEIKYDHYLPAHIGDMLQLNSRQRNSLSKYVLCRRFG